MVVIACYGVGLGSENPCEKGGRARGEELRKRNDSGFCNLCFDSRGYKSDNYDISKRGECDEAREDTVSRYVAAEYLAEELGGYECGTSSVAEFRLADCTEVCDVGQDVEE